MDQTHLAKYGFEDSSDACAFLEDAGYTISNYLTISLPNNGKHTVKPRENAAIKYLVERYDYYSDDYKT